MPGFTINSIILVTLVAILVIMSFILMVVACRKEQAAREKLYDTVDRNIAILAKALEEYIKCESRRFEKYANNSESNSRFELGVEKQNRQIVEGYPVQEDLSEFVSKNAETAVKFGEDV